MSKIWYAVQLSYGAAKPAKQCKYVFTDEKKKARKLVCETSSESLIERSCRIAGVDLYMPVERQFNIHHRTKKPIEQRRPLIPAHAFVRGVKSFYQLIEMDGIANVVSVGLNPFPISEREIDDLRKAESAINAEYEKAKARYERSKMKLTRADIEEMHPIGSVRTISGGPFDGLTGEVEALKGWARVKLMTGKLGIIELGVDQLEVMCQKVA